MTYLGADLLAAPVTDPLGGIPRPTGDPGSAREAGHVYEAAGHEIVSVSRQLINAVSGVVGGAWVSMAGLSCEHATGELARMHVRVGEHATEAASALLTCAGRWEQALAQYDQARYLAGEAVAEENARRSVAAQAAAADPAGASGIVADAADYVSPLRYRSVALAQEALALYRQATQQAVGHLRSVSSTLQELGLERRPHESIEHYLDRIKWEILGLVPSARQAESLVRALTWYATMSGLTTTVGLTAWNLYKYFGNPAKYYVRYPSAIGRLPEQILLGGARMFGQRSKIYAWSQLGVKLLNGVPYAIADDAANTVARTLDLTKIARMAPQGQKLTHMALSTGLLRYAGIGGSLAATGMSVANVVSQGNPKEAFEKHGTGYLADWAELSFNASLTATMVAPNPVTAGATVVTGAAWAGLEIHDRWGEEIGNAVQTGWEVTKMGFRNPETIPIVGGVAQPVAIDGIQSGFARINPFD